MNKNEFKKFCHTTFMQRGFEKVKSMYYLKGEKEVMCGIDLQKSDYGPVYYVNYYFFIMTGDSSVSFPSKYDLDIEDRIIAMSKTQKYKGKQFMTAQIEYEEYNADELRPYFDKELEEKILPPVYQGKKYILDNLGKKYFLTLRQREVLEKLKE